MLLEAIYEGTFSNYSHGFRPGRACHTALEQVETNWNGTSWFVEFDIKGYFDNINHEILVNILEERIDDRRFIKLIINPANKTLNYDIKSLYCEHGKNRYQATL